MASAALEKGACISQNHCKSENRSPMLPKPGLLSDFSLHHFTLLLQADPPAHRSIQNLYLLLSGDK